jgi:hypothetical protein
MNVEERLARLERENRRLKVAGLLALLAVASAFLMGQTRVPQRIVASEFVLVNASGEVMAQLGAYGEDGMASLSLRPPTPNGSELFVGYIKATRTVIPDDPTSTRTEFEPAISMRSPGAQSDTRMGLDIRPDLVHRVAEIKMMDVNGRVFWTAP